MKHLLLICSLVLSQLTLAKGIRTVATNDIKMTPVYLQMSQATVLRFKERPKKIILGNSNYISAEFTDDDVTLQPLGRLNTNLFVYTQKRTYGFHLIIKNSSRYDDLVNVEWYDNQAQIYRQKKITTNLISKIHRLSSHFILRVEAMKRLSDGTQILECVFTNQNEAVVDTSKFKVYATRNNIRLPAQQYAFDRDLVYHGEKSRLRLILAERQKLGFTLNFRTKLKNYKFIIGRRDL